MKGRTAKDLRDLSNDELMIAIRENEDTLTKLRFQRVLGQLQNTSQLNTLRKDIARIKTVLHERAQG
ncbi:MAG TPA: 50S ribosomal protein L29 [Candidatus Kapabacteria bacterium]|jgi:large subunit ribosomal protein L29|nr:50S ribosomal protein L29 [Ignavibacteria bacterium]HRI31028.1 50S ribosomal protein L29 [Candidatus Kapabacteria bacterium]HRK58074.1 50S ribosomal protein L29 [Candidatus Kapabacteria bacterium]